MTEVVDPASLTEAAQKAAAAGDFPAAERILREIAAIQEATLGPEHEDLASTLNNLAFMCERTNNIADAETYYRRAHAIAVASLSPRHPFVATSIKNLVDFCAAHDIPIWKPPRTGADENATVAVQSDAQTEMTSERASVAAGPWPMRTLAIAALGVVAIVAIAYTTRSPAPSAPVATPSPLPTTPAIGRESAPTPVEAPAPSEPPAPRAKTVTVAPVTVLNARLCRALKRNGSPDWQCSSLRLRQDSGETGLQLQPGTYFFYTRLLTSASTTVEHRWYRDGRLHQMMRLRISANPNGGYRTYSSNTISSERAGDWKVELRAADGTLLHEERFLVR